MSILFNKYKSLSIYLRASFWFLICGFLQKGISVITTPIFTRLLNTSEYGSYNAFNSWYSIVYIIVSLNLSGGVYQQGLVKFEKDRYKFSSSLQGLTITSITIWTIVYFACHNFINNLFDLTTIQMLSMLCMTWTSATFGFWLYEQRVDLKYRTLVIVTLAVSLAKPILGIVLVTHSSDKVTARILGLVIVEFVGYSWCCFVQMYRGKVFFSKTIWKYALNFNLPLIPHYLSQVVLNNSDRIMIKSMVGDSAAGIYSLAYSLAVIMTIFNTALSQTLTPWIYQKIKDKEIKDLASIGYLSLLMIAIVNMLLIMFAPEIVTIFAPASYFQAIYCIPPISMSMLFLFSYNLFAGFAFYYEKTKYIMAASLVGAGLNILLNYYGIKTFGYIAAAYTTLICYILYSIFHYKVMISICNTELDGIKPYRTKYLVIFGCLFLSCGFVGLFSYRFPLLRYTIICVIAICAILYRRKIVYSIKKIKALRR